MAEVERLLPDFANSCRDKADVVIIHQDAFAADYQDHEYSRLGKAIKFAGLHGKEVRIIGKNRETRKGSIAAMRMRSSPMEVSSESASVLGPSHRLVPPLPAYRVTLPSTTFAT